MSKVANMLNMVKILEDGKIHTIQDLADELEVSTRMVRIYKQELEQAGIYIQGKQGINGGYILANMKNTIDIGLTGEELYQLKNMKKNELDEAIIDKIIKAYITNEHRKDSTKSEQLMPEFTEIYKILCNCSVPSQLRAKMHKKSPSVMAFWLVCLGILTYSCQNTSRDSGY